MYKKKHLREISKNAIKNFFLIFILTLMLFHSFAFSREDYIPGSRYTSGRAAGLGDAFLPLATDPASGLFYNPAELGRIRKVEVASFNVSGYGNLNYFSHLTGNSIYFLDMSKFQKTLVENSGKRFAGGAAFLTSFSFYGFAIGILLQSQISGIYNGNNTVGYRFLYQFIPAIGNGFHFLKGALRVGYSLQFISSTIGEATKYDLSKMSYRWGLAQGSALSHNVGISMDLPGFFHPTASFVFRNFLNASYHLPAIMPFAIESRGVPATEKMTMDAAYGLYPRIDHRAILNLIFEEKDIFNVSNVSLLRRFSVGAELSYKKKVFLRAGYSGGSPTAGFGIKRKHAEMSIAWYTEDLGSSSLSQKDRRVLLEYQLRNF